MGLHQLCYPTSTPAVVTDQITASLVWFGVDGLQIVCQILPPSNHPSKSPQLHPITLENHATGDAQKGAIAFAAL
jgi:hypothetical protein